MARELPRYDAPHPSASGPSWRPDTMIAVNQTDGTLSRRFFAYLIDLLMIVLFSTFLSVAIAVIGLLTFGLGWSLFAILPASAIIYNAITVGGPRQSTIGMRMMGLRVVDATTGGPVGMLTAAVHALLFYVAAGTFVLWVLDLFLGVARSDRRLGHDLLTGVVLVRSF
jgi:uncharacterized RDD family membrane protein YckC